MSGMAYVLVAHTPANGSGRVRHHRLPFFSDGSLPVCHVRAVRTVDDQDLYTIVITTYIPPRQVGDGPWTPWYADYYHPAV